VIFVLGVIFFSDGEKEESAAPEGKRKTQPVISDQNVAFIVL